MFEFYNNLFPEGTKPPATIDIRNTYIKYGVSTTIDMKVSGANGTYEGKRKNAFLGNMASFLGRYEGIKILDSGVYDGMSTSIIGPNGTPEYVLAEEIVRKQNAWRNELASVRSMVEENLDRVNLVGVLYNMLRMYYAKQLRAMKYAGDSKYYDNGHVSITNEQVFGVDGDCLLWESFDIQDADVVMTYTKTPADVQGSEIFYDIGSNPNPVMHVLIRHAHAEWKSDQAFLLTHPSPQLSDKVVIVGGRLPGRVPALKDLKASEIKAGIGEFVRKNACYRDFEIAYSMIVSVMTKPVPRSAEAISWHKNPINVRIPKPAWIRGLVPELYLGAQYARGPEWQDCFYSWYKSSMSAVVHSVAMQEAVYTEIFHLTRVTSYDDIDRDSFMTYATSLADCPNAGIMVDTVLTCMRYGRECTFRYTTSAGVDRLATIPNQLETKQLVSVKDPAAADYYNMCNMEEGVAELNIMSYAPVTYPSLSYGVNDDGYYMNSDKASVTVKHRVQDGKMIFTDPAEFSQYMSMMRLFGYDVLATDVNSKTKKRIHNWADNASGRYIYVHNPEDIAPRFEIHWKDIMKRANSWMELPTLYGDVTFSYSLGKKALTWFSGDERIGFCSEPLVSVKRNEFLKAVSQLSQAKPSVRIIPLHRRSDFLETRLSVTASRPALAPASLDIASGPLITTGVTDPDPAAEAMEPDN
jgi:hypothetical protein